MDEKGNAEQDRIGFDDIHGTRIVQKAVGGGLEHLLQRPAPADAIERNCIDDFRPLGLIVPSVFGNGAVVFQAAHQRIKRVCRLSIQQLKLTLAALV